MSTCMQGRLGGLACVLVLLAGGGNPLSEFQRAWWFPGALRGVSLRFELCGPVVDSRLASQPLDRRLLFAAQLPVSLLLAGAVGRVEASDGRSFASVPHNMTHDLRVSRRSEGVPEPIAVRL